MGGRDMTFEDLWKRVKGLPDTAMAQIPDALSDSTKTRLAKRSPEKVKEIILSAIYEVDHGSVSRLEELIQKRL